MLRRAALRSCAAALALSAAGCSPSSGVADAGDAGPEAGSDAAEAGGDPVAALFASGCAVSGCHAGPNPPQQLDLSAGAYFSNLVGVPAAEVYDTLRVRPGDATDTGSYLLCKVDPECVPVGDHMPLGTGLSVDQIATLRQWIASLPPDADASAPSYGIDSTPPTFAGVTAASPGPSSITLSWAAASDDSSAQADIQYLVYQAPSPGGESYAAPTAVTPAGATSFAVGKLAPSTTYYFVVRARDLAGNVDANTVELSATTPSTVDSTAPVFAGASTAAAQSPGSVSLAWSAATDDVSPPSQISYLIYASTTSNGQSFAAPDVVTLAGATSQIASGLAAGTTYYFVVRARDQAGNVDLNVNQVTATTAPVSFAADVWPLMGTACTTAGCHAGSHPAEGMDLGTAASAYAALVGVPSSECAGASLVEPSSASASYLMQKLRGYGPCFVGFRMPEQGPPMSPAGIDLVGAWIGAGAPDN